MNMKKYEEFCSKCSFYENEECNMMILALSKLIIMDMLHVQYSFDDIVKKYRCPYQIEILIKSFNEEKEGSNK
ncbi:MAG: hypothetical protein IKP65_01190 [Alphaproteobacteria bacterium]|nr:hypothetical protein [Alphaproteobacteria bacterium]